MAQNHLCHGTDALVPDCYHEAMKMDAISLETAIAITDRSRRTWWRRIAEGTITRIADGAGGPSDRRTMISWAEVVPYIRIPMSSEDLAFMLCADGGDADAQNDIGQLFSAAGQHEIALYWLRQAAQQNHPDAMQCLGRCYLGGQGVPKDEHLGVMWIAKAAAHGHAIAQAQMAALRPQ